MSTARRFLPEWLSPSAATAFVVATGLLHALPHVFQLSPYDHNQIT